MTLDEALAYLTQQGYQIEEIPLARRFNITTRGAFPLTIEKSASAMIRLAERRKARPSWQEFCADKPGEEKERP